MINIKDLLIKGQVIFGLYVNFTDPTIVEIAAYAGFDFIRIDCEHTLFDNSVLANMIRTATNINLPVIVRVSTITDITRILDFGASGIMVPHVNSREKAIEAVKLVKYYPLGERGIFGSARCLKYGNDNLKDYIGKANDLVSLIVQIEDNDGLNNIDKILSVEGIDMVATGKGDLSQAFGVPGELNHEKVLQAEEKVIQKAFQYKKWPTLIARTPERIAELVSKGVSCILVGPDTALTLRALKDYLVNLKKNSV